MKKVSLEIGANPPQDRKSLTIPEMKSNFYVDRNLDVILIYIYFEKYCFLIPPYPFEQENMIQHNERLQATR